MVIGFDIIIGSMAASMAQSPNNYKQWFGDAC